MIRQIALFRDPRMWVVVVTALVIRGGFELYANAAVEAELAEYDAKQAAMSPDERAAGDAARAHAIGALVGVEIDPTMLPTDTGAPDAPTVAQEAPPVRASASATRLTSKPATQAIAEPARGASALSVAAAVFGFLLVAGAGAFGAWRLWREADEDEAPPEV